MRKTFKIFSLSFFLVTVSFAQVKPEKCPDISVIQSVGIIDIQKNPPSWNEWSAGVISNTFSTNEPWTFYIPVDKAADASEAKSIASKTLSLLQAPIGPAALNDHWICIYFSSDQTESGAAATPAYDHLPPITGFSLPYRQK